MQYPFSGTGAIDQDFPYPSIFLSAFADVARPVEDDLLRSFAVVERCERTARFIATMSHQVIVFAPA
jgi:hypothetical protein